MLTLALCLAALVGLAAFPMAPEAEAVDRTIDKCGFKNPEKTTGYIYYWHKGIPPIEWDYDTLAKAGKTSDFDYKNYPVLITWDQKNFLKIDASFAKTFQDRFADETHLWQYHHIGKYTGRKVNELDWWEHYLDFYDMNKNGLLSNLDFYSELSKNGTTVSLEDSVVGLPWLTPASLWGRHQYLMGVPVFAGTMLDPNIRPTVFWDSLGGTETVYTEEDKVNWLVPEVDLWASGNDGTKFDIGFGVLHGSAERIMASDFVYVPANDALLPRFNSNLQKAMQDEKSFYNKWYTLWIHGGANYQHKQGNFIWEIINGRESLSLAYRALKTAIPEGERGDVLLQPMQQKMAKLEQAMRAEAPEPEAEPQLE